MRLLVINQEQSFKFVSYNMRKIIFSNKKQLQKTQFSIIESLTVERMGILKETRQKHQFRNVWTADGKILYKNGNKINLNFTTINLVFNVVVNVTRK